MQIAVISYIMECLHIFTVFGRKNMMFAVLQSTSPWPLFNHLLSESQGCGMWCMWPLYLVAIQLQKKNCLDHGNIWKPSIHPGSGNQRRISLTLQWPTGFRLPKGILRLVHEISWPKLRLDDNKVLITWLGGARLGVGCGWHMLTQLLKLHWQKTIFCKPCSKMFLSIHQWEFQDPNMEDPYIW